MYEEMNNESMNDEVIEIDTCEVTDTQESKSIGMLAFGVGSALLAAVAFGLVKKFNNPEKKAERCEARLAKKHAKMIAAMEREGYVVMRKEDYQEIQDEVQAEEAE